MGEPTCWSRAETACFVRAGMRCVRLGEWPYRRTRGMVVFKQSIGRNWLEGS